MQRHLEVVVVPAPARLLLLLLQLPLLAAAAVTRRHRLHMTYVGSDGRGDIYRRTAGRLDHWRAARRAVALVVPVHTGNGAGGGRHL